MHRLGVLCFTTLARERLAGTGLLLMHPLRVLCCVFTHLAQWRRAGNRAPTDRLIKVLCFTNLARERQAGNNSLQATETTT